jgi:hypothetical protein
VKEQTEDICIQAIKQNELTFHHVIEKNRLDYNYVIEQPEKFYMAIKQII